MHLTSTRRRAILGCMVGGGLFLAAELAATLLLGPPPLPPEVARVSTTRVSAEGDQLVLAQRVNPDQVLRYPLTGDGRPRVAVIGGSSVQRGFHHRPEVDFPTWLARAQPQVEVLNLGSPGLNSAAMLTIVRQLGPVELDLLVVYEGHNDWSQPVFTRGVAKADLWTLSIYRALAFSWAWSTLHHAGHAMVPRPPGTPTRTHATADDTALDLADAVARAYAAHLTDIVDESPAPVLFTTLLRNFDHPPQGTLAADPAACQAWINDQPKLAEADVDAARAHCGEGALPDWIAAQGHSRAGQTEAAVLRWQGSLLADPIPLRAPFVADAISRQVAADLGAPLVDLAALLGPLPPGHLFDDTLHPNAKGAEAIAEALAPGILAALAAGDRGE